MDMQKKPKKCGCKISAIFSLGLVPLWRSKRVSKKVKIIITVVAGVICIGILSDQPETATKNQQTAAPITLETTEAKPYKIFSSNDMSVNGRKRKKYNVVSDAKTRKERAHTAIKAAIDLQSSSKNDVVSVAIEPSKDIAGKGFALAIASFAVDGQGWGANDWKWQVVVADELITEQQLIVVEEWYKNRDDFQKDGMTDEPALTKFLASKLSLPIEQITFPVVTLKDYQTNNNQITIDLN